MLDTRTEGISANILKLYNVVTSIVNDVSKRSSTLGHVQEEIAVEKEKVQNNKNGTTLKKSRGKYLVAGNNHVG